MRIMRLVWFWIGMFFVLLVFVIPGLTITIMALFKRLVGWALQRDPDRWTPFPNAPRFWNWVVYRIARVFMMTKMDVRLSEDARVALSSASRAVFLSNHPTDIEFPYSFRLVFEIVRAHGILSTQASWNRWVIFGPLFDMAGAPIGLRRVKDGHVRGEGRKDLRDGLQRLWKKHTVVHLYPDSNRPSPERVAHANQKYSTDFTYIVSPRTGGVKAILDHCDTTELGSVPILLMSAGFGFRCGVKEFWRWSELLGKTYFAHIDVVMSDTLPRDERELAVWLGAWASGCDAKLQIAAQHNGFTP